MLINIDPLLGPQLLMALRGMGHGDEIAIVDANYPAESNAQHLIRMDGVSATRMLTAIVSVLPLDTYADAPVHTMQVVGDADAVPEIVNEFHQIVNQPLAGEVNCGSIERFAFYQRVKNACTVVATGERRLYGNIILTKGVVG